MGPDVSFSLPSQVLEPTSGRIQGVYVSERDGKSIESVLTRRKFERRPLRPGSPAFSRLTSRLTGILAPDP